MQAGRNRKRITIQYETVTRDTVGGEVISWSTFATVYAEVLASPAPADEQFITNADQLQARTFLRIKMRWLSGVSVKHRITFDNRTLQIHSVGDPDGRKRELRLVVSEVLA